MLFSKLMLNRFKAYLLLPSICIASLCFGQINSPYSRFGLGDMYNSRNVVNKGMGGLATATFDYQSVNFINPASYSRLQSVTLDVGIEYESRTMRNATKTEKYNSANFLYNYFALGMPLKKDKLGATVWGLALGLRPVSRVNYNLTETGRLPGIDSFATNFEGNGGASRAFIGTGARVKNVSFGINAGFLFGQNDINTRRTLINDTVAYFSTRFQQQTAYSKFFVDAGVQWEIKASKKARFLLGANGYLGQNANATANIRRETYLPSATGEVDSLDVALSQTGVEGTITFPAGYSLGVVFDKMDNFFVGVEWEQAMWSKYRFFGQTENFANSSMFRIGGQWIPTMLPTRNYFKRVTYRLGFYSGRDFLQHNGSPLPIWAFTAGAALPVRR
ncbi:MAG: hypothetical protein EAY75_00710, partial [Bacteroidetes bacterium]